MTHPKISVPAPGECECGDPRCAYVANLATTIEQLHAMAGQPSSDTEETETDA